MGFPNADIGGIPAARLASLRCAMSAMKIIAVIATPEAIIDRRHLSLSLLSEFREELAVAKREGSDPFIWQAELFLTWDQ